MKKISIIFLSITFLLFSGCATLNPYHRFYVNKLEANKTVHDYSQFILTNEDPVMYYSNNMKNDINKLYQDGYVMIGYSSFNAGATYTKNALRQARLVNAEIVLVNSKYTNTITGTREKRVSYTETSNTNSSGNVGGYNYSGTSTTRTNKKQIYDVPYSINKYNHGAVYFVKQKPLTLGVSFGPIPDEVRARIRRNRGAYINVVMNYSPAFYADLIPGDIIISVSGEEINDVREFNKIIDKYSGKKTEFEIIRNGEVNSEYIYIDLN